MKLCMAYICVVDHFILSSFFIPFLMDVCNQYNYPAAYRPCWTVHHPPTEATLNYVRRSALGTLVFPGFIYMT